MPPIVPYFATPSRDNRIDERQTGAISDARPCWPQRAERVFSTSLLAYTFNTMYAHALNLRGDGITHFVMVHDDVVPQDAGGVNWSHLLFKAMLEHDLGVISCVIPIKDETGTTSTGIDAKDEDPMRVRRIMVGEWPPGTTVTSDQEPRLLINTGCMAIDLTKPWSERLYFHIKDGIRRKPDGTFEAWVDSEDWNLSRMLRRERVRYGATTAVQCWHVGTKVYGRA